ncbi:serine hydroxymethyltransferase [Gordonia polyisoprenivorans]|uniref:serine hydroxymethyltransferase n=1 Tax=Gordonia polyisoprenivorans TaxID=84595 RepID=UPI001AD78882|nr:serine hydroxymethyltransferase [Gordonia polyisoprenivorans]QTI71337.1 serine hydroxymethyltransferase [Gordonia polyisoprenivorans]
MGVGDDAIDAELATLIDRETRRRAQTLQLVAGETIASSAVHRILATPLADTYAEGYPGARYHGGCEVVDEIEELAIARAASLFGAAYVNVQPVSGTAAASAVYAAFAQPGDPVLSLRLDHGGHQTHGSRANFSGRWFTTIRYAVGEADELVDYDQIRDLALLHRPRLLVAGSATYSRLFDYPTLRQIADEAECILWVDAAHLGGLVAGGVAPSPVPHADVVTMVTHKVLRGPRGGLLLGADRHRAALQKAVFPFTQGAPSMHVIAAKAATFAEAATAAHARYASATVENARALAAALTERGLRIVSGGTDTHLAVVDVSTTGLSGVQAQQRLHGAGIVVDKAVLPFDPRPVAEGSAIRIGTPIATLAGADAGTMTQIADWMVAALSDPSQHARIRGSVAELLAG